MDRLLILISRLVERKLSELIQLAELLHDAADWG
jgi:hypothetical protein